MGKTGLFLCSILVMSDMLFAESPCTADVHGHNRMEVPVNYLSGSNASGAAAIVLNYNNHKLEVSLILGDRFEPQKVLQISIDNSYTSIYDPKTNQLFQHGLDDGTRIQCYFKQMR